MNGKKLADISIKFKLKELLSHGVIFGITSSLQSVLGFILLPILTNYYTPAEFGVYSIILLLSAFASALFYLGASSALGRFYYDEDSDDFRKKIISATLLITAFGGTLLALITYFCSKFISIWLFHNAFYTLHIQIALYSTIFSFLLTTMTLILRYRKKPVMFMIVTIAGVLVNFFITYILLTRFHYGLLSPLYGSLISNSGSFIFIISQHLKFLTIKLPKSMINQLLFFGLQTSVSSILFYLLDWVDRLIIKDLLPMKDVGVYSLGYRLGSILNIILVLPFSLIWAPIRMQYANNQNNNLFVSKVISYFTITCVLMVFTAVLFEKELMVIFFKNPAYIEAAKLYPIIMMSMVFYGFQSIVDFGIYLKKKVFYYIIITATGLIFNIAMNYWLIPIYGYIAAAYVTLLTYVFTVTLIYFAAMQFYKLTIEWARIITPMLLLILIYSCFNYLNYFMNYNLLQKLLVFIVLIIFLIKFWLTNDEKQALLAFKTKR